MLAPVRGASNAFVSESSEFDAPMLVYFPFTDVNGVWWVGRSPQMDGHASRFPSGSPLEARERRAHLPYQAMFGSFIGLEDRVL